MAETMEELEHEIVLVGWFKDGSQTLIVSDPENNKAIRYGYLQGWLETRDSMARWEDSHYFTLTAKGKKQLATRK